MNNGLVSHIYVAIVFRFLILFHVFIYVDNTCTYIKIQVLKIVQNLFKELEVFCNLIWIGIYFLFKIS
jgi:hypothetical protein